MFKQLIFCAMLLTSFPLTVYAAQGTIRETDDAIIIEYSGENDEDVKASKIVKEREEKQTAVDDERRRTLIEQSKAKKSAKEAGRNVVRDDAGAEKNTAPDINSGEEKTAGEEKKEGE